MIKTRFKKTNILLSPTTSMESNGPSRTELALLTSLFRLFLSLSVLLVVRDLTSSGNLFQRTGPQCSLTQNILSANLDPVSYSIQTPSEVWTGPVIALVDGKLGIIIHLCKISNTKSTLKVQSRQSKCYFCKIWPTVETVVGTMHLHCLKFTLVEMNVCTNEPTCP